MSDVIKNAQELSEKIKNIPEIKEFLKIKEEYEHNQPNSIKQT